MKERCSVGFSAVPIFSLAMACSGHKSPAKHMKISTVLPNPSLNLRANGMPQSPRYSAGVHYLCRGLCVTPLSSG
jgi:hypothetical protein